MPTFLSVDCGTTVVKATLMDEEFHLIDDEKRQVTVHTPREGYCETDMDETWKRLCEITRSLKSRNEKAFAALKCVGIAGQGDGLWPVDKNGRPVCRALLWNDTRSKDIDFDAIEGLPGVIRARHANQVFAGSVGALLTWLKRNRPEDFAKTHMALHCKDWLNYRLTGALFTDRSDASTALYDHIGGRYVPEMLDLMGIPEAEKMLPDFADSISLIGSVTPEAALETGLPAGTPIAEGCIDICAVALGSDVNRAGRACTIIGTTLCSEIALKKEDINFAETRGLLVHHCVPHLYMRVLPTLSGASTMDFMKSLLFPGESYPEIEKKIDQLPIGSAGLICHPYICGERAPIKNPFATAGFFGLTTAHSTLHMMRATFEGLALSCYDCYSILDKGYEEIYLSGGASVSPTVCQMFTDTLGTPCRRVDAKELGTLGVARLLMAATGAVLSVEDFPDQKATVFYPDMARHEKYMQAYALFRSLQDGMKDFWMKRMILV